MIFCAKWHWAKLHWKNVAKCVPLKKTVSKSVSQNFLKKGEGDLASADMWIPPKTILARFITCLKRHSLSLFFNQRLSWDPADYGNVTLIQPLHTDIWLPNLALINTVDQRFLFNDDQQYVSQLLETAYFTS